MHYRNYIFGMAALLSISSSAYSDSLSKWGRVNATGVTGIKYLKAGAVTYNTQSSAAIYDRRCKEDSLSPSQAIGRFDWLEKCESNAMIAWWDGMYPEDKGLPASDKLNYMRQDFLYHRGKPALKPMYFTLVDSKLANPLKYYAPVDKNASCGGIPAGYMISGSTCRSSCYHPSQKIDFDGQDVAIKDAADQMLDQVTILDATATLDNLETSLAKVDKYTVSLYDTDHELLRITTESGANLLVTPNHPLIVSTGEMVEAKDLVVDQSSLVTAIGDKETVVGINEVEYFGKVYNLRTVSKDLNGQIVIAEGFLSGSDWYQNEGFDHLNRVILRNSIDF